MPFDYDLDVPSPARLPGLPLLAKEQWIGGPGQFQFIRADPFEFSGSVGPNGDNKREDVIKAQLLLGNSGHYRIAGKGVPTGWAGGELFRSIRAFQKEKGLQADGLLLPLRPQGVDKNGVGETLMVLHGDLGARLAGYAAPTPQEVDAYYENEARFSGAPDDGDKAGPPSDIFLYDEGGQAAHPVGMKKAASGEPREIRRDVDPPQPSWQDGQRIAMAAGPGQPVYAPPPPVPPTSQTGATKPHSPYPHEQPDVEAAGLQLEKIVDTALNNAAANMKRWYENGQAFVDGFERRDLPLSEAEQAAFTTLPGAEATPPSRPMDDADQAATKTPPLVPPKADAKLQGRPAEEQEPATEKLIPPDLSEWVGKLPPQEQPFAKDLTGLILDRNEFGSRGKPETEKATRVAVKACLAELKNFPEMADRIKHFAGSYQDGSDDPEKYRKEEVVRQEGSRTYSRPDASFGDGRFSDPKEMGNSPYSARLNTVDVKMTASEHDESGMTANESRRYAKLKSNIQAGVTGWARKMKLGESEAAYTKYVTTRCRAMWGDLDRKLRDDGVLPAMD